MSLVDSQHLLINYSPLNNIGYSEYVYHFFSLLFIAMGRYHLCHDDIGQTGSPRGFTSLIQRLPKKIFIVSQNDLLFSLCYALKELNTRFTFLFISLSNTILCLVKRSLCHFQGAAHSLALIHVQFALGHLDYH